MTLRAVSVDFASKWIDLGDVCFKVIRCDNVPNDRWHRSFSDVYSLCISRPDPHTPRLYEAVTALLKDRITEILNELSSIENNVLLNGYVSHWNVFHRGLEALDNLFKFVNNQYVRPKRPAESDMCYGETVPTAEKHNMEIFQLGLSLWKTHLIEPLQCRLTACLLTEIANDRLGIVSQQHCIVPCLESFLRIDELKGLTKVAFNVYFHVFESPLVEETRMCYTTWAARAIASASCTEYVSEALKFLNDESKRAMRYYKDSHAHFVSLFNEIVVQQHLDFLNASVAQFVKEENREVLRNFYQLLAPTNHCSELLKCFGSHVKAVVNEIIAGIPNDQNLAPAYFVDTLLVTRSRFTVFIDDVFDGMSTYRNEMDKAFGQAINSAAQIASPKSSSLSSSVSSGRNPVRAAEYLSRYMDSLLRRSTKQYTEAELENKIAASINLFKYVEEKDIFKQYYQRNLCYRLLFGSSTLLELEESTINQLNAVCGYEFTSKFQRMFNDIQLADGLNANFQSYLREKNLAFPFAHHCHVLTLSAWPISLTNDFQFCLPVDLLAFSAQFEAFYASSFNGRNLRWALSHCTAEVRMFCADKPYTLFLAALSAATLLLFDKMDVDELTTRNLALALFPDVSGALSSAERMEMVRRAVMPLVDAGILLLTSSDKQIQAISPVDDVTVRINRNYTNRHTKVKVAFAPQTLKNAIAEEGEQVEKKVEEDRRYFTQAAIVRIMKSRKTCKHTMLVNDVIDMAKGRFKPPVSLIKRCIEVLIEKGYLERNPDDADEYNYLA